jgi:hypothetical protein
MLIRPIALLGTLMLLCSNQAKALTTFNLSGDSLSELSEVNLTADGISLKIFDFVSETNLSIADSDGLCFAGNAPDPNNDFCNRTSSLKLQFDKPIKLISYITGFEDYTGSGFPLLLRFRRMLPLRFKQVL